MILLQHQIPLRHNRRMGPSHIAKMPWLMGNAGHRFLAGPIPFHKAIIHRPAAKFLTNTAIGKVRANKIQIRPCLSQVNGQPRLMLTVSGEGHELLGKSTPVLTQRTLAKSPAAPAASAIR